MDKILIIKIGAIGDLLMTTPAIRALKKTYPTTHISLLAGRSSKMAVSGNPHIDELIECDDYIIYKARFLQKARYALSLLYLLRKKKFDTVIIFHRDWRFNLFAFLCGIPERIGFNRNGEGRFLTKRIEINDVRHQIDHYLEIVKSFGIHDDGRDMDFAISKEAENVVDKMLQVGGFGNDDIKIGISAGGAKNVKEEMPSRRWPIEYYGELSNKIVADGYKVILLGADSDKLNATNNILDLTGKTTLEQTAAVMKQCAAIVTHDSGPMHLASAVGVPVISIFGPTDPKEKYPLSPISYYFWNVENIKCAPCYKDGNFPDCQNPTCMKAVTVEQVYEKVKDIIGARGR